MERWKAIGVIAMSAVLVGAAATVLHRPKAAVQGGHVRVVESRTGSTGAERASSTTEGGPKAGAGLPLWANYRLIPVWSEAGQPMYVNGSVDPVLIFSVSDPGPAAQVLETASKVRGAHPITLVAAGFATQSVAAAGKQAAQVAARWFHGQAVMLLQGPAATYASALPVFAYVGRTATSPTVMEAGGGVKESALSAAFSRTLAGVAPPAPKDAKAPTAPGSHRTGGTKG